MNELKAAANMPNAGAESSGHCMSFV